MFDNLLKVLHQREGPLTDKLRQADGGFDLGQVPAERKPDSLAKCVCGFCSTGCSLTIHLKDGQPVGLTPTVDYPVNAGMACPKGWEALSVPAGRGPGDGTPLARAGRKLCARRLGSRSADVRRPLPRHSGQSTETNRSPFSARASCRPRKWPCSGRWPSSAWGWSTATETRGSAWRRRSSPTRNRSASTPRRTLITILKSPTSIVLVGSNLCIAHPIMWQRVMRNPHQPEIVVIDPRRTETAMCATQHLAVAPKSDLTLLYGVARLLIANGWIDARLSSSGTRRGSRSLPNSSQPFTLEAVAAATGLAARRSKRFARTIHEGQRVSFWWTMGVNQSHQGVRTAQAIINLALMTGNIGRPGTGANSITGQCNAMGSRLFSNTTNLLGGRDFTESAAPGRGRPHPRHRSGPNPRSQQLGLRRDPRRASCAARSTACGSSAPTRPIPGSTRTDAGRRCSSRLDFLVVQDMYHTTETARCAT